MAAGGPVQDLCDELTCLDWPDPDLTGLIQRGSSYVLKFLCPICLNYFTDPVTIAGCGHNFCQVCLTQNWGDKEEDVAKGISCPNCRRITQRKSLIPNRALKNMVDIGKKLNLGEQEKDRKVEGVCEKHQEPLKLFCKDHQARICLVCDKSKEHESHKVVPQEEAFQEYKDQIFGKLKILRAEREKILTYKTDAEKESRDLLNQTEEERQKTQAGFRQMHQFLEEQEKSLLDQIVEVEKKIARRRDEHLARLCKELSSLENVIQEMQTKCQQPASEFLQDIRKTLKRYEKKEAFENPVAFPPELLCRIRELYDVKPLVERVMEPFPAKVTLDPDTAHPQLMLSEDCKCVRFELKRQDLPKNPERFNIRRCVLGLEGFTAGRHFWDVTVGSEGYWAVGVARKSVRREGKFNHGPEEGIWSVEQVVGHYRVSNPPDNPPLNLSQELKRIRVTLNCAEEQVAFSDANTDVHIYTYSGASFCGETLLPFFCVAGDAHLRLSP